MGSAFKWVFYVLFGTTSIVKLFHSFEYRKIPGYNSLCRCPLYSSAIFKSWVQLLTVSIFALPNKSPPFRLSHSASENLLNVNVLHFLDKQCFPEFVLLITVLNNREQKVCFSENFHLQTLRVDLNPRILKICASWMSVWNISANYVLVPVKFH